MDVSEIQVDTAATVEKDIVECEEGLEEEEDIFFQDIEMLADHNIAMEDINELKKIGINTIKGVQMIMRRKMLKLKGFTEEKVNMIKEACCKIALASSFMTALEVSDQRKQVFKLSTGSKNLE